MAPSSLKPPVSEMCRPVNTLVECVWVCVCARVCVQCIQVMCSPFPPLPCSCAPLNMSDVLERGITTGAEREASSLSSPSPLYITPYWLQAQFILPSSFSLSYFLLLYLSIFTPPPPPSFKCLYAYSLLCPSATVSILFNWVYFTAPLTVIHQ